MNFYFAFILVFDKIILMKNIVFSGIQPTGIVHLGNYLGAISNWVKLQDEVEKSYFCLVDLHAITANSFDPKKIQNDILQNLAIYLSCGLDPKKATIFKQSDVKAHSELGWILNIVTHMGELQRMTQYKEKTNGQKNIKAGLFNYPILQAADILLYQANLVPVGEDQHQHIELARIICRRFNNKFGKVFTIPQEYSTETKRVMALNNPSIKMSKSIANSYISLLDSPQTVKSRFDQAVTDSTKDASGIGGTNLMILLNSFAKPEIIKKHQDDKKNNQISYKELKQDLTNAINEFLMPIIEKTNQFLNKKRLLEDILADGAKKAEIPANKTLNEVFIKLGLKK